MEKAVRKKEKKIEKHNKRVAASQARLLKTIKAKYGHHLKDLFPNIDFNTLTLEQIFEKRGDLPAATQEQIDRFKQYGTTSYSFTPGGNVFDILGKFSTGDTKFTQLEFDLIMQKALGNQLMKDEAGKYIVPTYGLDPMGSGMGGGEWGGSDIKEYRNVKKWEPSTNEADWLEWMKYAHPHQYSTYTGQTWNKLTGEFTPIRDDGVPDDGQPLQPATPTPDEETPGDGGTIPTGSIDASGIASTYNLTGVGDMYDYLKDKEEGTTYKPITDTYGTLTYSADGGRVPAAYGGIMGDDGRRQYGIGSIFKSIFKPFKGIARGIKKFSKSKAGKLALMAALGYFGGGGGLGSFKGWGGTGFGGSPLAKMVTGGGGKLKDLWSGKLPEMSSGMDLFGGRQREGGLWNWIKGHPKTSIGFGLGLLSLLDKGGDENDMWNKWYAKKQAQDKYWIPRFDPSNFRRIDFSAPAADGGRIGYQGGYNVDDEEEDRVAALRALYGMRRNAQEGGLMDMGGMEKDYRNDGGFVPIGGQERADDVPARLSKNEFVFTADAVRAAGGGDIDAGAEIMENVMENLEQGGQVSEESQGLEGARDMFATAQRLEGVL
jgi:hypothetical protein